MAEGPLDNFQLMQSYLPLMAEAVKFAEGNPKNFGVLSVKTQNPGQVLKNSVNNNFSRWTQGKNPAPWISDKPTKFVDFMRRRWAPLTSEGATNDPDNLNVNWAPNVRFYLKENMPVEDYEKLRQLNFVKNQQGVQRYG